MTTDPQLIWVALAGIGATCTTLLAVLLALLSLAVKHGKTQEKVESLERKDKERGQEMIVLENKITSCKETLFEHLVSKAEFTGYVKQQEMVTVQNEKDHGMLMTVGVDTQNEMRIMRKCMETLAAGGTNCD